MSTKMNISSDINVYTCTIGRKATQAKYFLSDSYQIVSVLEQVHEVQEKINNGSIDVDKKGGRRRHQSIANFNTNFMANRLIDKIDNNDVIKTRTGGDFTRHNGKSKFKFGQLQGMRQQSMILNPDMFKSKQFQMQQQNDSSRQQSQSSANNKNGQQNRKRGIAQKLATKLGGSESMSEDFGSQAGKGDNYAVGSEVNFGSDNDD